MFAFVLISLSFFMLLECQHFHLSFNGLYLNSFSCLLFVYSFLFFKNKKTKKNHLFLDSNLKMLCPIKFKLDRKIDHHHSYVAVKIGLILSVCLSVFLSVCLSINIFISRL